MEDVDMFRETDMLTNTPLGNEVRRELAKILARFNGLDIAAVRTSTISKTAAYINDLEMRIAAQSPEPAAYALKTKNRPIDAHFQLRNLKRMRAEDNQIGGWEAVDAAVRARQVALAGAAR